MLKLKEVCFYLFVFLVISLSSKAKVLYQNEEIFFFFLSLDHDAFQVEPEVIDFESFAVEHEASQLPNKRLDLTLKHILV